MFLKKYTFGGTEIVYREAPVEGHEGKTAVGLAAYPAALGVREEELSFDSLVQVAFAGDEALVDYTEGVTMRNRSSTLLKIVEQVSDMGGVKTVLTDGAGNFYTHFLCYDEGSGVFSAKVVYENRSEEIRLLERLDSLSLCGISSSRGTAGLVLHRMTSAWSRECRLRSDPFSRLGLEMSWARYGVKTEKWGQNGSMPNRGYFPFGAVEDPRRGICWGVLLEAPYSWQLEVYQEKESCALSGGLADHETGHWRKEILPGERFETECAFFTVKEDLTAVCNAFVHFQDARLRVPPSEEELPVLFNEYCTTWGEPSAANIERILTALEGLPIQTFVIDCGWYKPDDKGWCNAIGDWKESAVLFPQGIKAAADLIRAHGKRPGVWFEFENVGRDSEAFWREDLLLKRDGKVVTSKNRRFLDLRKGETEAYLSRRMLDFLKENGFGYIKIDYNDTYGIGCDSEDGAAFGEGGRQVAEASLEWLERIKEIPDIVIENCSSGGSRIEPKRMGMVSMCSFSDAHECDEIPLVAANVSRVIPARQSQIWAVIRKGEPDRRTIYSLTAAMMGRICLSGDVVGMPPAKKELITRGLAFYEEVKEIVRAGDILSIDNTVEYYRDPKGRQVYVKEYNGRRLVLLHFLDCRKREKIAAEGYRLLQAYTDLDYTMSEDGLTVFGKRFHAAAFLLEKSRPRSDR